MGKKRPGRCAAKPLLHSLRRDEVKGPITTTLANEVLPGKAMLQHEIWSKSAGVRNIISGVRLRSGSMPH